MKKKIITASITLLSMATLTACFPTSPIPPGLRIINPVGGRDKPPVPRVPVTTEPVVITPTPDQEVVSAPGRFQTPVPRVPVPHPAD